MGLSDRSNTGLIEGIVPRRFGETDRARRSILVNSYVHDTVSLLMQLPGKGWVIVCPYFELIVIANSRDILEG